MGSAGASRTSPRAHGDRGEFGEASGAIGAMLGRNAGSRRAGRWGTGPPQSRGGEQKSTWTPKGAARGPGKPRGGGVSSRQLRPARRDLYGAQVVVVGHGDSHQSEAISALVPSAAHCLRRAGVGATASPAAPRKSWRRFRQWTGRAPLQERATAPARPRPVSQTTCRERTPPPARETAALEEKESYGQELLF